MMQNRDPTHREGRGLTKEEIFFPKKHFFFLTVRFFGCVFVLQACCSVEYEVFKILQNGSKVFTDLCFLGLLGLC